MNKFKNGDVVIFKGEKSVNAYFRKLGIRPATPYRVQAVQEGYVFLYGKKPGIHGALVRKAIKDPMDFKDGNFVHVLDNTVHIAYNNLVGTLRVNPDGTYSVIGKNTGRTFNVGSDPIIKVIKFAPQTKKNLEFLIGDVIQVVGNLPENRNIEGQLGVVLDYTGKTGYPYTVQIGNYRGDWRNNNGDTKLIHRNESKPKVETVTLPSGRVVTKESYDKANALLVEVK
ncbi:hypothetical protein KBA63_00705 [Candidatus Woesebacteria bacterium]|nr:hypothetical protein [Candidatus Woesebacteria bacterium]